MILLFLFIDKRLVDKYLIPRKTFTAVAMAQTTIYILLRLDNPKKQLYTTTSCIFGWFETTTHGGQCQKTR